MFFKCFLITCISFTTVFFNKKDCSFHLKIKNECCLKIQDALYKVQTVQAKVKYKGWQKTETIDIYQASVPLACSVIFHTSYGHVKNGHQ